MSNITRRVPLASIANATNSPHRPLSNSGSKRPRSLANVSQQENEPPQKRLAVEKHARDTHTSATPHRQAQPTMAEGRVFERGNGESGATAFQRRLVAVRDKNAGLRVTKNVDDSGKEDTIRTWQRHYRKLFPSYRFYFDGVSEDARSRFLRQITALGAKEEKFFSKAVTHIITSRNIPAEASRNNDTTQHAPVDDQPQTINPSLLEKNPRGHVTAPIRRDGMNHMDILVRGREMGMKIWAAEKLQRVLTSILEDAGHATHGRGSTHTGRNQHEDLGQVLKNEKLSAYSEREQPFLSLLAFKGPYIYVHDMDEKYRPTVVREYPKVSRRSEGEWPQFRSASVGKCPFVEDPAMRREIEQEQRTRARMIGLQQQQQQAVEPQMPRTRSHGTTIDAGKVDPPRRTSPRKALQVVHNTANLPVDMDVEIKDTKAQKHTHERQPSFPPMPEKPAFEFVRPPQLHLTREPAASGIQRSNLTSAIQSQMISSTAATGVKAGTSKEVHHQLKRQVLERTHTGSLSVGSIPSSHRMNDLAGALKNVRAPAPQRAAKAKAQEKLGGIQEEADSHADDFAAERAAQSTRRKKAVKRDPKPGYCENCRDKYDDFEEHVISRKHRKFAMTQTNWTELDALLAKLQSP
ncbi:Cdc7p-Dbf4p kinase complex regulatory subunit [Exophiala sideris]|uniref:Cdc7p-Dbf4p kinase complex regulatory subunit n=1 Tax=Exophiala sideris TaxID=1016849 RepID=A0ABR0JJD7_9EURO|nr:Cdc7p-Dbf4p kinase complex regulatory subunit [Exophiala sideris]KAK5035070.1 Cdc7p-Dbf4p kinase complex regulatory subunit [Exophiala sideris]KAK5065993.1 Cdc7p-Dbf4p kinase complex regulatory subunit [Exophiala sideris]KAK5178339.1 Cdc7p-Dbf4p kinase complex regulatory subunit [Eurotiomycetes sp. CCFEE 6388]